MKGKKRISFFISAMLILALPFAFADDVSSSASITNSAPTVGAVTAIDPITLSEGTTVLAECNATITDTNGYVDVSSVNGTLFDTSRSTENASSDFNNHYDNTSCATSGGSGTTVNARCTFAVHFSANATDWDCYIRAIDGSDATGVNNVSTVTINQLKALGVTSTLAFGSLALSANSSELNVSVNNTGNALIDISLDGYGASDGDGDAMACTAGGSEFPFANFKYNLTATQDFDTNMTALTDSAVTLSGFNLAEETTDSTESAKEVFWKIRVPDTDVGGSCTGTVVVTAV